MLAHNKLSHILPLLLAFWSSLCVAVQIVYRADSRAPSTIEAAGGFEPRGGSGFQQVAPNTSLWNHAHGDANGFSRVNDGYVSTTSSIDVAMNWIRDHLGGDGYVYAISAGMNFIDVRETLLHHNPFPNEFELAAMGGVELRQIRGVRVVRNNLVIDERDNTRYNRSYEGLRGGGSQPQLAGFPANHPAWREAPWAQYAHCHAHPVDDTDDVPEDSADGSADKRRSRIDRRVEVCVAKQSARQAAETYMKAQCGHGAC